ncbi:MAG: riboflavin synthase [Bacteroidales bacterium]|nr:riboflavin synthase [Bacteroidales bacterium]MDD4603068.1 riboflavin synthase [Bacteroidales bacterium]
MFTGIVEETGTVREIRMSAESLQLVIGAKAIMEDVKVGDSINTNGVCLTVISIETGGFTVDVMPETLRRSNFQELKINSEVNLERALRLSDRLGGHWVSGHIDGTGKIQKRWQEGNAVWLSIMTAPELLRYVVEKGSVALDGISLTVVKVDQRSFSVSVIPHTRDITTLPGKKMGDSVNIECDILAKYLEKLFQTDPNGSRIDSDFLNKYGF